MMTQAQVSLGSWLSSRLYSLITVCVYVYVALFFLLPDVMSSPSLSTSGNEQHLSLSSLSDNAENSLVVLTVDPSQFRPMQPGKWRRSICMWRREVKIGTCLRISTYICRKSQWSLYEVQRLHHNHSCHAALSYPSRTPRNPLHHSHFYVVNYLYPP